MSRAVCPGSFDPVTHGHLDVIGRTSRLVDEVVVAVGKNVAKNALFSPQERVEMLREVTSDQPNVQVMLFEGLLVDFCSEQGAEVISKGLRTADFDYELQMAQMNRRLSGVDTVFLPTGAEWSYVSSSLIREIASLGGDVSPFVPASIADRITRRLSERNLEHGRQVRDL
jgi:pantetheine-phosphate adenylyltransferase